MRLTTLNIRLELLGELELWQAQPETVSHKRQVWRMLALKVEKGVGSETASVA